LNLSIGNRRASAGFFRRESTLYEKTKLKHWRAFSGKTGRRASPNGDLRVNVLEDCVAALDRKRQKRRSMVASGVVLRTDEAGIQSSN
jgi:hypothetical protein